MMTEEANDNIKTVVKETNGDIKAMAEEANDDLASLERHFRQRVDLASSCLRLRLGDTEATCATMNSARADLIGLKESIRETKVDMVKWRELITKTRLLQKFLSTANDSVDVVTKEMSAHPRLAALGQRHRQDAETTDSIDDGDELVKHEAQKKAAAKSSAPTAVGKKKPGGFHKVDYLTIAEFEAVPKYMRGRMTYETLNGAIDEYNNAVAKKYTFLGKGFQAMASIKEKKRFKELKSQEGSGPRGVQFVTAEELKDCTTLKSDANRRNIFTILRHCGRIREIRNPGMPMRIAVKTERTG